MPENRNVIDNLRRLMGGLSVLALLFGSVGCGEESPEKAADVAEEVSGQKQAPQAPAEDASPLPKGDASRSPAQTANQPPEVVSVEVTPPFAPPGTLLQAAVEGRDPDGDLVSYDYVWYRNEQKIVGGVGPEMTTEEFRKGDVLKVEVTPTDGEKSGEPAVSRPVVLANRPPEITSYPPAGMAEDRRFVYEVGASDPDGDALTFELEEKPSGMRIEAESGRITWKVPADIEGSFPVRVIASDGDARAFQGFAVRLERQ